MREPFISIIIPIYNSGKYLNKCIRSIINQNFRNFEIILINDGSTDNSKEICDKFSLIDNRIKVFHIINSGVSNARNIGIKNAKGKWITFIDADDWIENNYLLNLQKLATQNSCDLICYNYYIDNNGVSKKYCNHKSKTYFLESDKEKINFLATIIYPSYNKIIHSKYFDLSPVWNKIYKRGIIEEFNIEFDMHLKRSEDVLFNINYCQHISKVIMTDNCFLHYVKHPESATNVQNCNLINDLYKSASIIKTSIPIENPTISQCYLGRCLGYLYEHIKRNTTLSDIKKINNLLLMFETIRSVEWNFFKTFLPLRSKITIYLIKLKLYHLTFLFIFLTNKLK